MRLTAVVIVFSIGWSGCAGRASFHAGATTLAAPERHLLAGGPERERGGFRRMWKRPGALTPGLLKWTEDRSSVVDAAPADLLQCIRDGVGGLNHVARSGAPTFVTVNVYAYRKTWWGRPEAAYEIVGRDARGQLLWAADDTVEARPELAMSLVETASTLLARAVVAKLRKELGL
jgi:hypothetical protein